MERKLDSYRDSPGFSSSVEEVSKEEKIHLERVNSIPFSLFLPSAAIRYGDKASVDHAWRETTLLRHFHAYVSREETSIRIEGRGSTITIHLSNSFYLFNSIFFFLFIQVSSCADCWKIPSNLKVEDPRL